MTLIRVYTPQLPYTQIMFLKADSDICFIRFDSLLLLFF